jgi:hypothetical protein
MRFAAYNTSLLGSRKEIAGTGSKIRLTEKEVLMLKQLYPAGEKVVTRGTAVHFSCTCDALQPPSRSTHGSRPSVGSRFE